MALTILTEAELRRAISLDLEVVDAIAEAFSALAAGEVVMPPILHMALPEANGEVDVKTAWIPGPAELRDQGQPGLLRQPEAGPAEPVRHDDAAVGHHRPARGAASRQRLSHRAADRRRRGGRRASSGPRRRPRSPACSAPAARRRPRSRRSSSCGRSSASCCGRAIRPRPKPLPTGWPSGSLLDVLPVASAERLVLEADVVVTATPAAHAAGRRRLAAPRPAHHRDGLGCRRQERAPPGRAAARRSSGLRQPCAVRAAGRAASCPAPAAPTSPVTELGEITSGRRPGRQSDDQITVCDLTGTGVQDTAIALLAYQQGDRRRPRHPDRQLTTRPRRAARYCGCPVVEDAGDPGHQLRVGLRRLADLAILVDRDALGLLDRGDQLAIGLVAQLGRLGLALRALDARASIARPARLTSRAAVTNDSSLAWSYCS